LKTNGHLILSEAFPRLCRKKYFAIEKFETIFEANYAVSMKYASILLIVVTLLVAACKKNPLQVDISDIQADLSISRFEMDLFQPIHPV
jgi:hypothetical protein